MAPRAIWKGQLRLSLVSIPVEIFTATRRAARVSFRQIHEPSGRRVKYRKTVPGIGPVDSDDIVKGYETEKGEYMIIDPDEIDEIKLETRKTFELVQFVETREISPLYYDKPYYVVPEDELAQDAYRVVRDALRQSGKVGIGQITMRGKEYLAAVKPCGDGLLLETLHYEDELRDAEPMFDEIADEEADDELLEVATSLIEKKTASFDAAAFSDNYAEALNDLIEAKRKKKSTRHVTEDDEAAADEGENVVELMDALKQSVKKADGGRKTRKSGGKKAS